MKIGVDPECTSPKTNIRTKEADAEHLNQLCLLNWRFSFQGKPMMFLYFVLIKELELL